jgi:hypothetical protein
LHLPVPNFQTEIRALASEKPEELNTVAPERAARVCFLNVIGKYVSFLDKLIASQRLNHTVLDRNITTREELQAFVNECFDRETAKVARDTSLSNPKKVDCFPNASAYARDTSKAYFQLRRALEHHNDVPGNDLVISTQRIGYLAGTQEIKTLGVILREGEALSMKIFNEELLFPAGQKIILSPKSPYDLVFTMRMILAPEVFRSHVETP